MIRKLARYIQQYRRPSILTPVCMIGEVFMETLIPFIMASLIDQGVQKGDTGAILRHGALMLACAFVSLLFGIGGGLFGARASAGFAANLRKGIYDNIQTFSFANIDKFSTAGLITRLTTDVSNVQNAFQMILRIAVRAPLTLILSMIMCFVTSPRMSVIFLVAVVFLSVCLSLIVRMATKRFSVVFERYDDLNASVQENVSAIRVVKAFVREDHERTKFNLAADKLYSLFLRAERVVIMNSPVMMLTIYACIIMLSWMGARLIVTDGSLTPGDLTAMFSYVMSVLMSLMMLSMIFVMLTMSAASARRIAEVLDEKAGIVNPEHPLTEVKDGRIDFDHVTFSYKQGTGEAVLKDIDLHIRSGETIGIIGGTGSGKTSLVNLISRLYEVSEGAVRVGGEDVRSYDLEVLRDKVSVVLQKNVLFSGTILDNLRWGKPDATLEECREACRAACADEFIDRMPDGYETHIEQGGNNVSGGQKQRLCIARALLKDPKVLILDDSTSAVDTATDAKIRKAFREVIPGTTKLIIAQRIASVQDADRILVLDEGMVNGFGTHEELLKTNRIYQEIYETQTQGGGDFDRPEQIGGDQV
ncbi:MAG: ABC transporter ATP-binding protein [Clostridia bacterium]|nr:ABC transporter ATP-binding protein [Clostridia bacterium]